MITKQLAPYLLVSILIHAGALLGMHRFLSLPDAKEEAENLIPVEVVILPKPFSDSEPRLATGQWMSDQAGLHFSSGKLTEVGPTGVMTEPLDPNPVSQDLQPEVTFDRTVAEARTAVKHQGIPSAVSAEMATSGISTLRRSMTADRIAVAPPAAKGKAGEPQLTVKRSPELSATRMVSRARGTASDTAIPDYQSSAIHTFDADVQPPPVSSEPVVKPAVVLLAAKGEPSPKSLLKSQAVAAAPADMLSTGQPVSELRPFPKEVADEPQLMVATLQLTSHPSGAQVYVDDLPSGETPFDMELPVGKHEFRLVLPDHYDWKAQIELTDRKQPYPFFFRLLPVERD